MDHSHFSQRLLRWYHAHKRDLPWRGIRDPYKTWISEIMLQQTTVSAVIPRFERWVRVFPTIWSLADAPIRKVLAEWQGLGYYNRARNLHRAAQIMRDQYYGRVPDEKEILLKLPGLGLYTAGAVLSIAYRKRYSVIDANVRRVMMRILALRGRADGTQDRKVSAFLETVMPKRSAGNFNQALMELGALVCHRRKPLCLQCPLRIMCKAYQKGIQETIPLKVKKRITELQAVIAVVERNGRFLIQQRPSKGLLADLWEFPGGKIKPGEGAKQTLRREIREELDVDVVSARPYMRAHHFYTEYKVNLDVWRCQLSSYPPRNSRRRWVTRKGFSSYPFSSGSVKIIEQLRKDGS